ncbi:MAG: CPBP family intramembrane metalloprotease [Anaerolineae bacterium]|nr:CPBP family intramembrane metalloprotease [Anaerolineae bacterium]
MTATVIPSRPSQLPSRLVVNGYLVAGMAALILTSRPDVPTAARYAIGIGVEIALAAAALGCVRLERLPLKNTLRLRRADPLTLWLALAAVPGLWMIGVLLNLLSTWVLGYAPSVAPAQYPANGLEAVLLTLTAVVVAPVCEELMFRGYVQRAYEAHRPWVGVVVGGITFAAYHLRFHGFLGLVPIALALGLIAWRTGSLVPGMIVHAGFNAIATVLLIATSFLSMQAVAAVAAGLVCIGVFLLPFSLAAIWLLWRTTEPDPLRAVAAASRGALRWAWIVPAVVLMAVYAYSAFSEVLLNRFPETVLDDDLAFAADGTWMPSVAWHYSIQDRVGNEVGKAACARANAPSADDITLDCHASHVGFDLTEAIPGLVGGSKAYLDRWLPQLSDRLGFAIKSGPMDWALSTTWSEPALRITALVLRQTRDQREYALEYALSGEGTTVTHSSDGQPPKFVAVAASVDLMPREWAWRGSGLDFRLPYGSHVMLVHEDGQSSAESVRGFLQITGGEPVWTPSGNYVTWRVDLTWKDATGRTNAESAWYEARPPHTLVRYDDGAVSYLLTKVEATGTQGVGQAYDLLR